jgi:hypothetical protein
VDLGHRAHYIVSQGAGRVREPSGEHPPAHARVGV